MDILFIILVVVVVVVDVDVDVDVFLTASFALAALLSKQQLERERMSEMKKIRDGINWESICMRHACDVGDTGSTSFRIVLLLRQCGTIENDLGPANDRVSQPIDRLDLND